MIPTIQSQETKQSNLLILFVMVQSFFLLILIILYFCFRKSTDFKIINYYFKNLPLIKKIAIFFLINTLIIFIVFTLNQNKKINITKLEDYLMKFLLYNSKFYNKLQTKFTFLKKKKSQFIEVKADEQEILNNKYYFDDSEENKQRIIKSTFSTLRKDPRDYRSVEIRQHYQHDEAKRGDQFQIKAIHIKSEVNAYVFFNYNYDELILLDKLLTTEIEEFQNEQFDGQVVENLNNINSFLQSLGQINNIEKNPYDYILQYRKLPLNPTKMELCYNYLEKKKILQILRFELEKELRIEYLNKTGRIIPFIIY